MPVHRLVFGSLSLEEWLKMSNAEALRNWHRISPENKVTLGPVKRKYTKDQIRTEVWRGDGFACLFNMKAFKKAEMFTYALEELNKWLFREKDAVIKGECCLFPHSNTWQMRSFVCC
jgi:hypothetical protein